MGETDDELQAVLIDFGQAVDIRHPDSSNLLLRDIERVDSFFKRVGVAVMGIDESLRYIKGSRKLNKSDGALTG